MRDNLPMAKRFFAALQDMGGKEFLFSRIVYEIAPLLTGVKPASILTFGACSKNLLDLWDEHKEEARESTGVDWLELKRSGMQVTVLFYDSKRLGKLLHAEENRDFLCLQGYSADWDLAAILRELKLRMATSIPHEMGIVLGIPARDVAGYIENKGCGSLFCGYWKVYHNPERAKKLFRLYDLSRMRIMRGLLASSTCALHRDGLSLGRAG